MSEEARTSEVLEKALDAVRSRDSFSRREFLIVTGGMMVAVSALGAASAKEEPLIILEHAAGLIIADSTRCVGCLRCELACTEFNDGKASPTTARIKVRRNLNFGPKGLHMGQRAQGNWGNGLIVQDLCKQCPHPVPCATACPNDAIVLHPSTHARVVDPDKCKGCRLCQRACPWEMISFDADTDKATKCFLCNGSPKCVEACPAGALSYVAWRDITAEVPSRVAPTAIISPEKTKSCMDCHGK
jgi:Fe-S-cluster-containing dehydrogenase component